jgi:hypothetical protein
MDIEAWTTLFSLAVASAVMPGPIAVTMLLLRAPGGVPAAAAFVGGMTVVRLAQGVVFGVLLASAEAEGSADAGTVEAVLLLVLSIVLFIAAARAALADDDPDRPPPAWKAKIESMSAVTAFAIGLGYLLLGLKFWAFTLGAIAAVEEAAPEPGTAVVAFLVFVALAQALPLLAVAARLLAPVRSAAGLDAFSGWLARNDRRIAIVLGLTLGTWFGLQALRGLGLL